MLFFVTTAYGLARLDQSRDRHIVHCIPFVDFSSLMLRCNEQLCLRQVMSIVIKARRGEYGTDNACKAAASHNLLSVAYYALSITAWSSTQFPMACTHCSPYPVPPTCHEPGVTSASTGQANSRSEVRKTHQHHSPGNHQPKSSVAHRTPATRTFAATSSRRSTMSSRGPRASTTPMDFEWSNQSGPIDPNSPFLASSQQHKKRMLCSPLFSPQHMTCPAAT